MADQGQVVRAVVASAVGTTIEWYDFFLYGVAAALVFPRLFFPAADPFTGTLLSFSTYFVGFASRPIGAAIFGHYGDRLGRKASLIATLLLMGLATMAIGLVPSHASIGVGGAVLVTVGRVLQGIAVGGEWGGSALLAGEHGSAARRGFLTSSAQLGAPLGLLLANGALSLMVASTTEEDFLAWGWRVPFLASVVLIGVGLWVRVGIAETPVFAALKASGRIEKTPVLQVLRHNWREVVLTALARTSQQTPFYIFTTYVLTYGTQELRLSRGTMLNLVLVQALVSCFTIPLFAHLSDRIGRRRLTLVGCVLLGAWGFAYFELLDSGVFALVALAVAVALPIHDLQYGPQAALIAESFPSGVRYSGASLGYQLASLTAGGPAPLVAVWLFQKFGTSLAVAVYLAATAVVSFVAVALLPDRSRHALD